MKKRNVIQYTMDYEPVRVFDSVKEAEEYCHISHISSVCRYRRRSDGGYIWRYLQETDGRPDKTMVQ